MEKPRNNSFIKATALDYDLEYDVVEKIYRQNPDDKYQFYQDLEEEIEQKDKQ